MKAVILATEREEKLSEIDKWNKQNCKISRSGKR